MNDRANDYAHASECDLHRCPRLPQMAEPASVNGRIHLRNSLRDGCNGDAVNPKRATVDDKRESMASRLLPRVHSAYVLECALTRSSQPCATTPRLKELRSFQ